MDNWVVIEMADGKILQALNYCDRSKDEALDCAVDLVMENNYEYGRADARDILNNDGVLFVGDYAVYITTIK